MITRTILMATGMIIFFIGIILFPMPAPLGLPIMAIGLSIMLKASNQIKRFTIRLVRKNNYSNDLWRKVRRLSKGNRNRRYGQLR